MKPYEFRAVELTTMLTQKKVNTTKDYAKWFSKWQVKDDIKSFYMEQQDFRCCYCRQPFEDNRIVWHLEHILCESLYEQFLDEPCNLAASCPKCNMFKGKQDVLSSDYSRPPNCFPNNSADYIIPHPHFDDYNLHVELRSDLVYKAKNEKGRNLIRICKLNRGADAALGEPPGISVGPYASALFSLFGAMQAGNDLGCERSLQEIFTIKDQLMIDRIKRGSSKKRQEKAQ